MTLNYRLDPASKPSFCVFGSIASSDTCSYLLAVRTTGLSKDGAKKDRAGLSLGRALSVRNKVDSRNSKYYKLAVKKRMWDCFTWEMS